MVSKTLLPVTSIASRSCLDVEEIYLIYLHETVHDVHFYNSLGDGLNQFPADFLFCGFELLFCAGNL